MKPPSEKPMCQILLGSIASWVLRCSKAPCGHVARTCCDDGFEDHLASCFMPLRRRSLPQNRQCHFPLTYRILLSLPLWPPMPEISIANDTLLLVFTGKIRMPCALMGLTCIPHKSTPKKEPNSILWPSLSEYFFEAKADNSAASSDGNKQSTNYSSKPPTYHLAKHLAVSFKVSNSLLIGFLTVLLQITEHDFLGLLGIISDALPWWQFHLRLASNLAIRLFWQSFWGEAVGRTFFRFAIRRQVKKLRNSFGFVCRLEQKK